MATGKKRLLQRMRVPLGFLFSIVFLLVADPNPISLGMGFAVSIIGLAIRAWSAGHIRKNQEITVSGPYAHTRNPLYLGSLVMSIGFCIGSGIWWIGLIFIALFLSIYIPVMRIEAQDLREIFPESFLEYERSVPLLFPRLRPWKKQTAKFDPSLYLKYREYRALLGLLLAWLVLLAKFLWNTGYIIF